MIKMSFFRITWWTCDMVWGDAGASRFVDVLTLLKYASSLQSHELIGTAIMWLQISIIPTTCIWMEHCMLPDSLATQDGAYVNRKQTADRLIYFQKRNKSHGEAEKKGDEWKVFIIFASFTIKAKEKKSIAERTWRGEESEIQSNSNCTSCTYDVNAFAILTLRAKQFIPTRDLNLNAILGTNSGDLFCVRRFKGEASRRRWHNAKLGWWKVERVLRIVQ